MNELTTTLADFGQHNYSGAVFLTAYGLTWLVCAWLWWRLTPKTAAFATLFQGMVALPIALGVSAYLGMFEVRPGGDEITELSVMVAMGQLLALPLLIVLHARGNYTAVPVLFSLAGVVHFVPFAWLYQTPAYLIMPALLAIALAIIYGTDKDKVTSQLMSARGAALVCVATGGLLVSTAVGLVIGL